MPGATELFVVAAVTDEIGGEAITKRIREKLHGSHAEPLAVIRQALGESVKRERPLVHDLGTL